MATTGGAKLGGGALVLGSLLLISMTLLRPGGFLIEPTSKVPELTVVLGNYPALGHLTASLAALGFLMMFAGFYAISRAHRGSTAGDALVRFSLIPFGFAVVVLSANAGLTHIVIHLVTHGASAEGLGDPRIDLISGTLLFVRGGLKVIGGYGFLLGYIVLALGLYNQFAAGFHKVLALIAILVALVGLAALVIGTHAHDLTGISRLSLLSGYPLYIWSLVLGVSLFRGDPNLTERE